MTNQQPSYLDDEQQSRAEAARIASEILRTRGPAMFTGLPIGSRAVIDLAQWIIEGPVVSLLGVAVLEGSDDQVPDMDNGDDEPMISHRMLLELTYDSPIDQSTVDALVDSHQADEGLLRVRGRLLQ